MEERTSAGEIRANCEIPTDNANDWRNICSWLNECPPKSLMIEPDKFTTESTPQKEMNFTHDVRDTKEHTKYLKFDTLVGKEPKIEEFHEGNESTGENPCIAKGQNIIPESTKSIDLNKKNNIFDGPTNDIESLKQNEEQILQDEIRVKGEINDYYETRGEINEHYETRGEIKDYYEKRGEINDNYETRGEINDYDEDQEEEEEEYYIIEEEIIEDDERTGEDHFERTGEEHHERTGEDKNRREKRVERETESKLGLERGAKRKDYEVFVGGLNRKATKQDVFEVFSQTGDIQCIRMAFYPLTGANKGYAFVRYVTKEQAKNTLAKLKYPKVRGKRCEVRASHENDVLFLGHICKIWSKEQLKQKLKSYRITNYKELILIEDERKKGMNKGFAFLEFWSLPDAKRVYEMLQKSRFVLGTPRRVKVSFAKFDDHDPDIMSKVTTVFIDGMSPTWEEEYVKSCLKKYGTIKSVKLAKNMKTARRLDFGYVTFDSHENAVACIKGLNDKGFGKSGHRKVEVSAALSRPFKPRSKQETNRIRSGAKSSFDRHISISPQRYRSPSARISKRVSESRFSPLREREYKRIRTQSAFENYERSEYGSNHMKERRYYRDEDYYYCDDYCSEKSMHPYEREGRIRNFSKSRGSICQYEDVGHDMYDESSISWSKSRFDCDASCCNQRHERSHSTYRSSVSYKEPIYNNRHDDICYRDDNTRASNSSKYLSRAPHVGAGSSSSLHSDNSLRCDMFQGCPCCIRREYYWQ